MTLSVAPPAGDEHAASERDCEFAVAGIAAQALTIDERLRRGIVLKRPWPETARAALMSSWQEACAAADERRFEERLSWSGLDRTRAEAMIGEVAPLCRSQWPDWAECLFEALKVSEGIEDHAAPENNVAHSVPFGEIIEGFARHALRQLGPVRSDLERFFSPSAMSDFDAELRNRLSLICCQALMLEFNVKKSPLLVGTLGLSTSRIAYGPFVRSLLGTSIVPFLEKYPVLGRFIGTTMLQWTAFVSEFRDRLLSDAPRLQREFSLSADLRFDAVQLNISDPHNGGRVALRLLMTSGDALYYKPKSLRADTVFYSLLDSIAAATGDAPAQAPQMLDREQYGWVREVRQAPCNSAQEVERFYRASGRLLFAEYLAGGSDIHHQNLIASGEHPVVIDQECVMANLPGSQRAGALAISRARAQYLLESVMGTGMLPGWQANIDAEGASDVSALGHIDGAIPRFKRLQVKHPNSDAMRLFRAPSPAEEPKNTVHHQGRTVDAEQHLEEILAGFEQAFKACRSGNVVTRELTDALCGLRSRLIFRSTSIYAEYNLRLLAPSALRSGLNAQVAMESLYRGILLDNGGGPGLQPIVESEMTQLMALDIPLIHGNPGDTAAYLPDGRVVTDVFAEPAAAIFRRRSRHLSDEDLARQKSYISVSFDCRRDSGHTRQARNLVNHARADTQNPLSLEKMIRPVVDTIAAEVMKNAIAGDNGSLCWISAVHKPRLNVWHIMQMRTRLHDGTIGPALFLSAYARCFGGKEHEDAALGALSELFDRPRLSDNIRVLKLAGLGAGVGIGSAVYGLVRVSDILDRPALLENAAVIAGHVSAADIELAESTDLMSGIAGYLVAILALHQASPVAALLEVAKSCVDELLKRSTTTEEGGRFWIDPIGKPVAGFAYGSAGIAVALARAAQALSRPELMIAANEAMRFARTKFRLDASVHDCCNAAANMSATSSWCQGAAGLILAEMELSRIMSRSPGECVTPDLLGCLLKPDKMSLDHLCCGEFGRAVALERYARMTGRDDLLDIATEIYGAVLERWQKNGSFEFGWQPGFFVPSFHQGVTGIGYELLRLTFKPNLCDILAFA